MCKCGQCDISARVSNDTHMSTTESLTIEFLVGRFNQGYFTTNGIANEGPLNSPYSYQTWICAVSLRQLLRTALVYFDDGNSMKQYATSLLNNYYLFLWEFRIVQRPDLYTFKLNRIFDIDFPCKEAYEQNRPIFDEIFRNFSSSNIVIWRTGSKGYRIVENPVSHTGLGVSYLSPSYSAKKHLEEDPFAQQLKALHVDIEKYLDPAPLHKGHGVKHDLFPHPKTYQCPHTLTNPWMDRSDICGKKIASTWLDLVVLAEDYVRLLDLSTLERRNSCNPSAAPRYSVPRTIHMGPEHERHGLYKPLIHYNSTIGAEVVQTISKFEGIKADDLRVRYIRVIPQDTNTIYLVAFAHFFCQIHQKQHRSPQTYYMYNSTNKAFMFFYCHSSRMGICSNPRRIYIQSYVETVESIENDGFLKFEPDLRARILQSSCVRVHKQQYVSDLMVNEPRYRNSHLVLVKAAMGSGKTTGLKNLLHSFTPIPKRILAITTRRTCCEFLSDAYGLKPYISLAHEAYTTNEDKKDLALYDRICISMESLHYILRKSESAAPHYVLHHYDVVILDEMETILSGFTSPTLRNKRNNYNLFIEVIKGAKRVFAMDALLDLKTVGFFYDLGMLKDESRWVMLYNTMGFTTNHIIYGRYDCLEWYKRLRSDFCKIGKEKVRIAFVTDSKGLLILLWKMLCADFFAQTGEQVQDHKKFLMITGDSDEMDKYSAVTCNIWGDCDWIGLTPVVTVGNSDLSVYHSVYGVGVGTVLAGTLLQMFGRFRNVRTAEKHVLLIPDTQCVPMLETTEEIRAAVDFLRKETTDEMKKLIQTPSEILYARSEEEVQKLLQLDRAPTPINKLFFECIMEKFRSKKNLMGEFVRLLRLGYAPVVKFHNPNILSKEYMKNCRIFLKQLSLKHKKLELVPETSADNGLNKVSRAVITGALQSLGAPVCNQRYIYDTLTGAEIDLYPVYHPRHIMSCGMTLRNRILFDEINKTYNLLASYMWKDVDSSDLDVVQKAQRIMIQQSFYNYVKIMEYSPNENPEPLWRFVGAVFSIFHKIKVALSVEEKPREYYAGCLPKYFSIDEAEPIVKVQSLKDVLYDNGFWEIYAGVYKFDNPDFSEVKNYYITFFQNILPFFGIYYKKLAIRKYETIYTKNFKNRVAPYSMPKPYNLLRPGEPVKSGNKKYTTIYEINVEHTDTIGQLCMLETRQVDPRTHIPDSYPFKRFFIVQNQDNPMTPIPLEPIVPLSMSTSSCDTLDSIDESGPLSEELSFSESQELEFVLAEAENFVPQ